MLKKLLIASAILASSATAAIAAGTPYVGVGLGVNNTSTKISDTVDGSNVNRFGARSALINLFAGYGAMVNQTIYLAGEIFVNGTSAQAKTLADDGDTSKLTAKTSYGISFIPGVMLNESTMVYGRVGVVKGRFNAKGTNDGSSLSKNEILTGGQLGLGLETNVTRNVALRGEYDYTSYRSFKISNVKFSPKSDTFTLGVVYKFD